MNKKFMVVALMAALSTVATATIEDKVNANKVAIETINGTVNELQDKVQEFDKNFATKGEVNDAYAKAEAVEKENVRVNKEQDAVIAGKADADNVYTKVEADNKFATKGEVNDAYAKAEAVEKENVRVNKEQDAAIAGKVDKNEFYDKYNELHMGQTFTDETLKTHREQIEALDKNKVDKNTYEEDKKAQAETDKKQDATIAGKVDKSEFYDKYNELHMGQTFTDETLKTHREQIEALDKNKVDKNTYEEDKKAQAETDKKQDQALKDETTAREEADKVLGGRIDTLQQDFAKYDGRLSGLEKKVDNLDNKMNKGLSLMAAMNAVDFQNVQTGEMALGAGIGHYGNAQSVALGVAYSPVEDLTVNAKYSVTAGDVDSFALGAGATYKFKVGR